MHLSPSLHLHKAGEKAFLFFYLFILCAHWYFSSIYVYVRVSNNLELEFSTVVGCQELNMGLLEECTELLTSKLLSRSPQEMLKYLTRENPEPFFFSFSLLRQYLLDCSGWS